jgi:hypothetical protein
MATSEAKRRQPAGTGSAPQDTGQQDYLTPSAPKQAYKRARALRLAPDLLDAPTGSACSPQHESSDGRRSRAYIERFRKRIPLGRAIRLKCGSCMGGEVDQMPRGEVAQAIDECGSCTCPLWPFRFGSDPWRPELSEAKLAAVRRAGEKARRCLEAQRRTSAESATGHSAGTASPSPPEAP